MTEKDLRKIRVKDRLIKIEKFFPSSSDTGSGVGETYIVEDILDGKFVIFSTHPVKCTRDDLIRCFVVTEPIVDQEIPL